ncbi:MAG: hypothetical protein COV74_05160 [Candidatus Omnitrophica bacterium CG11_big_fil_rev_8_21_14_0_20_45_26]|uniref:HAMP domain-containing protein n=1 Tax=Candidatus Abzuiibacterium crystallinum TaxID=1974748 RepID=A0A2H0LRQ4_9BACT|nr:MAG: hypothetical protein COV74_05160 [Candidatus Omnitrophica bacterium CG11_big_fil_rev_8_21_14_0_20_45_26]PIW63541.1 MAG: hypothetical protein COW12_10070 [Candidatus Omnitrophica bacterium CG12_big_fil_rev_8_21_14_0_65_45_16]
MASQEKRKTRLFASHPPQRYFLLLQLGIFLATLVFLLSIIMTTVSSVMQQAYALVGSSDQLTSLFDAMVASLFFKIAILFICLFLLSALLGLFFLERLTGPLVRIQRVLEEIGSGRIPETDVHLRESDYPTELANALSSAIAYLRRKKAGM